MKTMTKALAVGLVFATAATACSSKPTGQDTTKLATSASAAPAGEQTDIARLEGKVQSLTKRVGGLESKLEGKVQSLTEQVTALQALVPRVIDLEVHEGQVRDCVLRVADYLDNTTEVVSNIQVYGPDPYGYIDGPSAVSLCVQYTGWTP